MIKNNFVSFKSISRISVIAMKNNMPTGMGFHLTRIMDVAEHFLTCGDYLNGVARIRCTNSECGHDYFRPFSCKGLNLCPSCSQKRTLLLAEHFTEEVLLKLPHSQFVFTRDAWASRKLASDQPSPKL